MLEMLNPDYWDAVTEEKWSGLAKAWLAQIRGEPQKRPFNFGGTVVLMRFNASPEKQWNFILLTVSLAQTEDELNSIAAGLIEHLLGWHGNDYIILVEEQAAIDKKFARAMLSVWQYMMTEEIWARVQVLQNQIRDELLLIEKQES